MILLLLLFLRLCSAVTVQCNGDPSSDADMLNKATSSCTPGTSVVVVGTCIIASTVLLPSACDFVGRSRTGSILKMANGSNLLAILSSRTWNASKPWTSAPSRVAHLGLDGNARFNNGSNVTAALIIQSWMSVVEDVHVYDSAGDGIKVTSLGRDGSTVLKTSQVNSRFDGLFIERSGGHGFHVEDPVNAVTDSNLLNSWISGSGKSGVYLENGAGWSVRNNHLYGNSMHGIYANRCYGTSIDGNYVEDFGVGSERRSGSGSESGSGSGSGSESESESGNSNIDSDNTEWFYGIACVPQSNSGSIISSNKVFQLRGESLNSTASFAYIGVPFTHGVGVLNVVNNLVRGVNGTRDVGLRYRVGDGGTELLVLSQGNNVVSVGAARDKDNKTMLMTGW